jgi:hypothetical protein
MALIRQFIALMQSGTWWIMWPIFGIGVVLWTIGIDRFVFIRRIRRARRKFLHSVNNIADFRTTGNLNYTKLLSGIKNAGITAHSSASLACGRGAGGEVEKYAIAIINKLWP